MLRQQQTHVVAKLKSLHKQYSEIAKHKGRQSAAQLKVEDEFTSKINVLFDIAHADWERQIVIAVDRQFLIDQRGSRQMSMTTEDLSYRNSAAKSSERKQVYETTGLLISAVRELQTLCTVKN